MRFFSVTQSPLLRLMFSLVRDLRIRIRLWLIESSIN